MWRARVGWNGSGDPRPVNWPQSASMGVSGASRLSTIDQVWDQPAIHHPFVSGPIISTPNISAANAYIQVYQGRIYAMADGVQRGTAYIERPLPLLPRLGPYYFDVKHSLVDNRWQFHTMNYPWNDSRRTKGWYNWESQPEWAAAIAAYREADQQILNNPQRTDLDPLDRDAEFSAFYGGRPPDFHPRVGGMCVTDRTLIAAQLIENPGGLIHRIQGPKGGGRGGVPERMANAFIKLYQDQIMQLQQQMPPPTQQIQGLQQFIDQLNQSKTTLY
jgi:hypothetical protein